MTKKDIKNSNDTTLAINSIKHWEFLINEYILIKDKKHSRFCFVQEFYNFYNIKRQNFIKYYNRYKLAKANIINTDNNNIDLDKINLDKINLDKINLDKINLDKINESLLPQKRGPKFLNNRTKVNDFIINRIKELRSNNGMNKYNIRKELELEYKQNEVNNPIDKIPSSSTIYNILKHNDLNKLNSEMLGNSRKEIKRIIKDNVGDMGHIDCHYLPKNIIKDNFKDRYFLIGLIDDKSRIISLELSKDIQAITVMFKTLNMINFLRNIYNIEFKEILTDNGSEFGGGKEKNNKTTHPFERLLKELDIKHRYTKPYHPQTNGKIERLWKTINSELLDEMVFDSEEHLKEELLKYVVYFNEYRSHASLGGKIPKDVIGNLSTN